MRYGYYSGMSYDEYLAHWGIVGMKWGQRRYQNPDGTLTPAGRERYSKGGSSSSSRLKNGAKIAGQALAKGAMAAGKVGAKAAGRVGEGIARGVKSKLAEKMPFMLNDEELARYRERLNLENTYRQSMANRRDLKKKAQGDQFVKNLAKDVISTSVKTVANKAVNTWIDEKLKDDDDRRKEELELERLEYGISKHKAESAANELKTKLNNDVAKQDEDAVQSRKLDDDRKAAAIEVRKIAQEIAEFNRNNPGVDDPTYDPDERRKLKVKRQKIADRLSKAADDYKKIAKEKQAIDKRMSEREKSLKNRRIMLDTFLIDSKQYKNVSDFLQNLSKDKQDDQMRNWWFSLPSSEQSRILAQIFNNPSP